MYNTITHWPTLDLSLLMSAYLEVATELGCRGWAAIGLEV